LVDEFYISRCFELAKNGYGWVSPNPLVGAVIVKNGKVIGEGWHKKYGGHHAEVEALKNASENVTGATLYCNLEPCCHTKKQTPPCAQMLIRQKIGKVVVSNLDPNPEVSGQGLKLLKNSGVKIVSTVLKNKGAWLNRFYFKNIIKGKPWITLKIAQSIDGKIALQKDAQTWITGTKSIEYVHRMRAIYDAVLVGANTVRADNPKLTVRHVKGRNPVRIILCGKEGLPSTAAILNDNEAPTWIITPDTGANRKKSVQSIGKMHYFSMDRSSTGRINLVNLLNMLAEQNICSILVEGGQTIFSQFLNENQFDDLIIFQSSDIFGQGVDSVRLEKKISILLHSVETIGSDIKLEYKNKSAVKFIKTIL
jgi:diaminohydroxyphosphoribosylaminopyrimidine deaminase/5-amino-6-(5-phosphoribosylamino)uracil reductase